MKLWPVVTGVAIALTLVACKSPRRRKAFSRLAGLTPAVTSENGMRSLAWRIASSEAWSR